MTTKATTWITSALTLSAITLLQGCATTPRPVKNIEEKEVLVVIKPVNNTNFYGRNGAFDAIKAKQAYFNLMTHFNYPIYDSFKTDTLKISDFGLSDFSHVGMASITWINKNYPTGGYQGREIFLLPGQMMAEYKTIQTENSLPKQSSWLVRHGSIYSFSVESTLGFFPDGIQIPESQRQVTKANNCKVINQGGYDTLKNEGGWHFIMGGSEGAIVTEFSTFFNPEGLRFSNPKVKL